MTWETFLRLWRWGSAISILGVLQFGICLTLAVEDYAGGTVMRPGAERYSFYENYLSDLGRSVAWSGGTNRMSARLFNSSLIVLALAQVPFFCSLPLHAADKPVPLWLAAGLGIISCIGLAGVGVTPYDLHLSAHITALMWWIVPLLIALFLHFFALLGSDECHPLFPLLSLALAILLADYAIRTAACGLPPQSHENTSALIHSIALQKYVVLSCVAWYLVFNLRTLLLVRSQTPATTHDKDRAALDYVDGLFRRM